MENFLSSREFSQFRSIFTFFFALWLTRKNVSRNFRIRHESYVVVASAINPLSLARLLNTESRHTKRKKDFKKILLFKWNSVSSIFYWNSKHEMCFRERKKYIFFYYWGGKNKRSEFSAEKCVYMRPMHGFGISNEGFFLFFRVDWILIFFPPSF